MNASFGMLPFHRVKRRQGDVNFDGGDIAADGGMLLLRGTDRHLGFMQSMYRAMVDPHVKNRCTHDQLPLYVFCGTQWLVSYLRPASCGAAYHAGAILKLLVARLRQVWPTVQIIFRGVRCVWWIGGMIFVFGRFGEIFRLGNL